MFNKLIEKQFSDGEAWSLTQQVRLPMHLQLLVEQQYIRRDIWELPNTQTDNNAPHQKVYPKEQS